MDNTTRKQIDEVESLKEDVRILTSHLAFMRSQLRTANAKLERNEKLLSIYVEALTEKQLPLSYNFSLN